MHITPCLICVPCLLYPGFVEDLPPGLTDIVEDACGNDEAWQVLLLHLEACAESSPVHLKAAEGALHRHVALAKALVEVLVSAVQLPHVGLQKLQHEG